MPDKVPALAREIALLPDRQRARLLKTMGGPARRSLLASWHAFAHAGQLAPPGDWRVWLLRAGRGFGKTRAGAEWISQFARNHPRARIALVGATIEDAVAVMITGESGLLAVARDDEPLIWRPASGTLTFASEARAFVYSAGAAERLRGPEHHVAWCDELAKWRQGDAAWDNLLLGLRLGEQQRVVVTTTPRANALMRRVIALPDMVETRGRTRDNPHLPGNFVAAMEALYGGTRLGRQELDGELIEDVPGALWTRGLIEAARVDAAPEIVRVVIGVDPPAGTLSGDARDACGIVAVAMGRDGLGYVVEDASIAASSPELWARAVAVCADRHAADRVVAEANNGGAMVKNVLLAADVTLPVRLVHASRGKAARAEPVAALYERGKVKHVGAFPALEDELCGLTTGGYEGPGRSPDRADALVWALSELMLRRPRQANIRPL